MEQHPSNQWLIRTAQNTIAGPYTKSQVCELIKSGDLGLQDEVCPANGYWIYLHEAEEVKAILGIEMPKRVKPSDGEITETQTELDAVTDPELEIPEAPQVEASGSHLANRSRREFSAKKDALRVQNGLLRPAAASVRGASTQDRPTAWSRFRRFLGF